MFGLKLKKEASGIRPLNARLLRVYEFLIAFNLLIKNQNLAAFEIFSKMVIIPSIYVEF